MRFLFCLGLLLLSACSTTPGPDKTVAGGVLGAAWGAGAGAVVGNQLENDPVGQGAAVGAGFGLVSGAIQGAGYDLAENSIIEQQKQLDDLQVQNHANALRIASLQANLDRKLEAQAGLIHLIYFDVDATSLRAGSVASLQKVAEVLKSSAGYDSIVVVGHSDDTGNPKYNERLALARARNVAGQLGNSGLAMDTIMIESKGAKHPVASNSTESGRQLNRRVEIYLNANN